MSSFIRTVVVGALGVICVVTNGMFSAVDDDAGASVHKVAQEERSGSTRPSQNVTCVGPPRDVWFVLAEALGAAEVRMYLEIERKVHVEARNQQSVVASRLHEHSIDEADFADLWRVVHNGDHCAWVDEMTCLVRPGGLSIVSCRLAAEIKRVRRTCPGAAVRVATVLVPIAAAREVLKSGEDVAIAYKRIDSSMYSVTVSHKDADLVARVMRRILTGFDSRHVRVAEWKPSVGLGVFFDAGT